MKQFVVLVVALVSALLVSGFTIKASAESVYIVERSVTGGRNIGNFPIQNMSDIRRTRLFGMNKDADSSIAALDYKKAYKCEADGSYAYFEVNLGTQNSSGVSLFKLYRLSGCTEVSRGEVLRAEQQKDEDRPTK